MSEATEPRGASANSGCARPVLPWTQRLHLLAECPREGRARARARASRIRMLMGGVRLVGGESGPPRRLAGAAKDLGQLEQIIAFHSVCP